MKDGGRIGRKKEGGMKRRREEGEAGGGGGIREKGGGAGGGSCASKLMKTKLKCKFSRLLFHVDRLSLDKWAQGTGQAAASRQVCTGVVGFRGPTHDLIKVCSRLSWSCKPPPD